MIFFEGNSNKKSILLTLVALFMFFIIFEYSRLNIINNISGDEKANVFWDEVGQVVGKTSTDFKNNFEVSKTDLEILKQKTDKETKQAILLENTKEFLENKKITSSTKATSTE